MKKLLHIGVGVIFAAVIIASLTDGFAAKYMWKSENESAVKAKEFYFTSDYLTPEGVEYTINPGTADTVNFTFELRNYDGLNVSEMDINYTVDVSPAPVSSSLGDKKIEIADGKKAESVTLTLNRGSSYTVTATGKNGYRQTLKATIKVADENLGIYKNTKDYGDYVVLTVWTEGVSANASFTVPTGLIPDATDSALKNKNADDTIAVSLNAYESKTYRLFTSVDYVKGNIAVSYGNTYLVETPLS